MFLILLIISYSNPLFFILSYHSQVFVDPLTSDDLVFIAEKKFPSLATDVDLPRVDTQEEAAVKTSHFLARKDKASSAPYLLLHGSSSFLSRMIAFNRLVISQGCNFHA